MFTGLVEGRGRLASVQKEGPAVRLTVCVPTCWQHPEQRPPCSVGDSVAVNGCCLTVVDVTGDTWTFQAGPETLQKTNLGALVPGDVVNLERALRVGDALGGHFVQGHIDGLGTVDDIVPEGEWTTMWIRLPSPLMRYVAPKGSIALDGVSLTVVDCQPQRFSVALIPHTLQVTTLGLRRAGQTVNIETDILAKYTERLLNADHPS